MVQIPDAPYIRAAERNGFPWCEDGGEAGEVFAAYEGGDLAFALLAVDGVIYGNKADTVVGKIAVRVVSNGNIVTAEAGQVFYHHGRHKAHFDVAEHLLKSGTVEIRSRIPVVHIVFGVGQTHLLCFLREQALLVGDGITVAVHSIVTG